jgi:TRAP-type C4-dicarboxylate transport system permease small subunit
VIPEWWMLAFVPVSLTLCIIVFLRNLRQPAPADRSLTGL